MRRVLMAMGTAAAVVALAACGGGNGETPDDGDTPSAQDPAGGGDQDALKIAILLDGETSDRGFNATGEQAVNMLIEEYGADATYTESVNVAQSVDIFRQYAQQGYDLVVGWGGQFSDGAATAAEEFPDTYFLAVSGSVENGSNLASYDTAIEDWQFLAGYVLAKMSKTGIVGQVSGQCYPSTAANQNGTRDGALYANPDIEWLATYTGDFTDPTKAQQAAQAMIDAGADGLTTNLNDAVWGVVQAAEDSGDVFVMTEWFDNSEIAPDVIGAALNKTYAPFLANKVDEIIAGEWKGDHQRFGLVEDWGPGVFKTDLLPQDVYDEVLEIQDKIVSGEIDVERDETCPGQ